MADHTHAKGEIMFSYRFMSMHMEDLKRGTEDEDYANILIPNGGKYMVTPIKMPMKMHMLGAMYAPSNKVTLMAMINYVSMEMDHITAMGVAFTTESSGFGDAKIGAIYKVFNKKRQQLHTSLLISLPSGAIDNKYVTPASDGEDVILPYPMQIGSGTFDAELGVTYLSQSGANLSFGSQLKGLFRTGKNDTNYRYGNRYNLNNWVAYKAANWISFSARLEGLVVGKIEGMNPDLNPMMVITADPRNSGGKYLNSGVGFNLYVPNGSLKNMRFGFEFAIPLAQHLNGVQLKQQEIITMGAQYSF